MFWIFQILFLNGSSQPLRAYYSCCGSTPFRGSWSLTRCQSFNLRFVGLGLFSYLSCFCKSQGFFLLCVCVCVCVYTLMCKFSENNNIFGQFSRFCLIWPHLWDFFPCFSVVVFIFSSLLWFLSFSTCNHFSRPSK